MKMPLHSGLLRRHGCWLCLLAAGAVATAQEMFTSFLMAQRLPQAPAPVLTLYGYPGSTLQVQYVDVLGSTNRWTALTNVTLMASAFTFSDPSLPPSGQRFYRALALAGTTLTVSNDWVWIPPGRFLMGSPTTEEGRVNTEGPQTVVTLTRGFYIDRKSTRLNSSHLGI